MPTPAIADHALIGNGRSAALVARGGTLGWLCWPEFDSPACFASLLGDARHGHWTVAPAAPATVRRAYRGGTLILETEFATAAGTVRLVDLMPRGAACVLRLVEGVRGRVAMRLLAAPRFGYGAEARPAARVPGGVCFAPGACLFGSEPLHLDGADAAAAFTVGEGDRAWFAWGAAPPGDPWALAVRAQGEQRRWAGRAEDATSLHVLRALCAGNGAMLAAPTTSLPEWPGGARNWDYRFCWLRDSALAAMALLRAGHAAEVAAWRDWLRRTVDPARPRALYAVSPGAETAERVLDHLPGHGGARPVRVGNAAAGQLQIDAVGVLLRALAAARDAGLAEPQGQWAFECALAGHLEGIWREPDEGIWEVRGGRRQFTHSKAMAWAGFDALLRSAGRHGLPAPLERWRAAREAVHALVCAEGIDPARGCFTQSFGGAAMDASLLLLSAVGFLPPQDARLRATVAAVERDLLRDGLVLRYRTEAGVDGLAGQEGAFLPCSFWLADAMAREGRVAAARALFARLCALRNDVGLLAEEADPAGGALLGNFPQAFSHIALLDSAALLGGCDGAGAAAL